jgi:hypothetical protein
LVLPVDQESEAIDEAWPWLTVDQRRHLAETAKAMALQNR